MKHFQTRGRLRNLPLPARIVYSIFLAFTLAALGLSAWLTEDMVGLDLERLGSYYAGGQTPSTSAAEPTGGPVLDLPAEADEPLVHEAMPLRKLLEITHFHLFSMPVYLLILSHLFMLADLGTRQKVFWIAAASLSVALHVAAPWFARAGGGTALYAISGIGLALGFGAMSLVPLWNMWGPVPPRQ